MLPFLIMLLLATAEIGRALLQFNTLQKSIRDATRYVAEEATGPDTEVIDLTSAVIATTRNLVVYGSPVAGEALLPGLEPGDVTVSSPDALHVQISVTYTYTPLFAVIPTFGLTQSDITAKTTMTSDQTMGGL